MTPERFKEFEEACPNGWKLVQQGELIPNSRDFEMKKSYHERISFTDHYTDGGIRFDRNRHVIIAYRPRQTQAREW